MSQLLRALVLCACILAINCGVTPQDKPLTDLQKDFKKDVVENKQEPTGPFNFLKRVMKYFEKKEEPKKVDTKLVDVQTPQNSTSKRNRRQADYGYDNFDDFYTNDFLYDYYDWVCSEEACQLCNILTSECCDPTVNVNCFLPDSCLNNPCLSGGTCVTTRTISGDFPDFICVCLPGFTGKYCQLTNEFLLAPALGGPGFGLGGPSDSGRTNVNNNNVPQGPPPPPPQGMQPSYGYPQQAPQPNYGYSQQAPVPSYGFQSQPNYGKPQSAPAPGPYQPQPQYAKPAPQRAPAPVPFPQPSYGQPQLAPVPPPAPYQPVPLPQPSGRQGGPVSPFPEQPSGYAKPLSASGSSWGGFDCNCQGKGYCAQVGSEENSEPEFFCICNDNTYGSQCTEGFQNPCVDTTMKAKFAPIDRKLPGHYFIECRTNLPYIRKCENGKRFNPKTNMCQTVKRTRPQASFQQFQQQQ